MDELSRLITGVAAMWGVYATVILIGLWKERNDLQRELDESEYNNKHYRRVIRNFRRILNDYDLPWIARCYVQRQSHIGQEFDDEETAEHLETTP